MSEQYEADDSPYGKMKVAFIARNVQYRELRARAEAMQRRIAELEAEVKRLKLVESAFALFAGETGQQVERDRAVIEAARRWDEATSDPDHHDFMARGRELKAAIREYDEAHDE